ARSRPSIACRPSRTYCAEAGSSTSRRWVTRSISAERSACRCPRSTTAIGSWPWRILDSEASRLAHVQSTRTAQPPANIMPATERSAPPSKDVMSTKIIYTQTDEAPALATYSLLPIVRAFTKAAGLAVETRDISLSGRLLASFPENLKPAQRQSDDLAELGELAKTPEANIIKLPYISASVPQLQAAIAELVQQGYSVPVYPEEPKSDAEKKIKARYGKVLGSAVNPVLREGNSDRRVAPSVKRYAKAHPHSMGKWSKDSKTHVASMTSGDFYANEQSAGVAKAAKLKIEYVDAAGKATVLKDSVAVDDAELVSSTVMRKRELREFYKSAIADAKKNGVLLSLHLKATMMKVSDPIMFGHAVSEYYADVFAKHGAMFAKLGVEPNNGVGDVYAKIGSLPADQQATIKAD